MGIGPSTKETSKHHFHDPLVEALGNDADINFKGIIIVGTPQDNTLKHLVGQRAAALAKAMDCDGAIISTDGWGNSDVDFANTLEQVGKKAISPIGLKFIGKQASFVVENDYTNFVIDFNKSASGTETQVVGENAIAPKDAQKALAAIKLKMRQDKKCQR